MKNIVDRGKTSLALKVGFWYVASTFLAKSLSFITTPIFSRMMSESDYGEFSNFANWFTTLFIVTSVEMFNTLPRAYYDFSDDYDQYNSSVTIASCGVAFIFYIIFLFLGDGIYNIVSIPPKYIHIMFVALMLQAGKQIYLTRERTLYKYKSVAIITALNIVIPTVIAVFLVGVLPETCKLDGRIYGNYIPIILIDLACTIYLVLKGRSFRIRYLKYAFSLSLPLFIHYFTTYLLTSTNVIIAKGVLGAEVAATVSIAISVIHILTVLFEALTGAVTTWMMDNLEQNDEKKIYKDSIIYILGLTAISCGVILFAPEIIWILGGTKYLGAIELIPMLVLSILIQTITSLFTIILTYEKKIAETAVFTGISAIVSIVLKIVMLPDFGIEILPFINCLVFLFLFVVNYFLVKKNGREKVINIKGIIGILLSVLLLALVAPILYSNTMVRYICILLILLTVIIMILTNKNRLLESIKNLKS